MSDQFAHSSPDVLQREVEALGEGEDNVKEDKVAVNYRDAGSSSTTCGSCSNYQGGGICALVDGDIDPAAVCDLYAPRTSSLVDLIG